MFCLVFLQSLPFVAGIAWSPNSGCVLATCSDDKKALIWDIGSIGTRQDEPQIEPCLAYDAAGEINQVLCASELNF